MARRIVVTGPPCGGKTTYVAQRKQPGDVVIDADGMASALAGDDEVTHDHPEHIVRLAAAAHFRVRRLAARMDCTVWVIHANPSADELEQHRADGAEIVVIDPGHDVVRKRCAELRPSKAMQWVEDWYSGRP